MLVRSLGLAVLLSACAHATLLTSFSATMMAGDPTQTDRLFRDGVPSDWSTVKTFPGTTAVGTVHYLSFVIPVGLENFLQISIDDPSTPGGSVFAAGYQTAYTGPNATNYLGDEGSSGNPFFNPRFFNVVAAQNSNFVLVLMEINPGSGVGNSFDIFIEAFLDENYTELTPVPEPATIGFAAAGLLLVIGAARKRGRFLRHS